MLAKNEKMQQNLNYLADTLNLREPEKVPTNLQTTTWPYGYAGVKLMDVVDDPAANAAAYTKVYDDIEFNVSTFGINAMPIRLFEALGIEKYYMGGDGVAILHKQSGEDYFGPEFYDAVKAGGAYAVAGYSDQVMKNCIPGFQGTKEEAVATAKKALPVMSNIFAFNQIGAAKLETLGIPIIMNMSGYMDVPFWMGPFSAVLDTYRGIKEALIDLRRRPEAVREACAAVAEYKDMIYHYNPDVEALKKQFEGHTVVIGGNILNAECFLNRKNFNDLYLDYMKKQIGPYLEAGAKVFVFFEGRLNKVADMYLDLPKGSLMIQPDLDDAFEIYDIIKDHHTICAGATVEMLKCSSKEDCIAYAKKCFDTFAPGGGFIFQHNKALTGGNDVDIENFRAVYEFANEYGRKG